MQKATGMTHGPMKVVARDRRQFFVQRRCTDRQVARLSGVVEQAALDQTQRFRQTHAARA